MLIIILVTMATNMMMIMDVYVHVGGAAFWTCTKRWDTWGWQGARSYWATSLENTALHQNYNVYGQSDTS
jgi:hypothetical protein